MPLRAAWIAAWMVASGCGGDSLRSLPGSLDSSGYAPTMLGVDGADNPVLQRTDLSVVAWDGEGFSESPILPAGTCALRDSVAEGNIAMSGEGTWRWDGAAYERIGPLSPRGACDRSSAIAGNGDAFSMTAIDTGDGGAELVRAAGPDGTWEPAFPEQPLDIGYPSAIHADADGAVWLLGRSGVARVSADGATLTPIGSCATSDLFQCDYPTSLTEAEDGRVDPDGNLVFVVGRVLDSVIQHQELHRVLAGTTVIEPLFPDEPPGMTCLMSYGIGPDSRVWAVWGNDGCQIAGNFALYLRDPGDPEWKEVIALENGNGWLVAVSQRGTVYLTQGGVLGLGAFVLER